MHTHAFVVHQRICTRSSDALKHNLLHNVLHNLPYSCISWFFKQTNILLNQHGIIISKSFLIWRLFDGHSDKVRTLLGRSPQSEFDLCALVIFAILEFLTGSVFHKGSFLSSHWSTYEKKRFYIQCQASLNYNNSGRVTKRKFWYDICLTFDCVSNPHRRRLEYGYVWWCSSLRNQSEIIIWIRRICSLALYFDWWIKVAWKEVDWFL